MTQIPVDWHPTWTSYEWWGDIGTGLLSLVAAVLVGGITATVAIRSHLLARRVAKESDDRAKSDAADRYRDQMVRVTEPAIGELVLFGNTLNSAKMINTDAENQLRASTISRLMLVDAVANVADREVTSLILQTFIDASLHERWTVRVMVAGRLAGVLAEAIGKQHTTEELVSDVRTAIEEEAAKIEAKIKAAADERAEPAM